MSKPVRGYKVFNADWTCGDKQYTCPGKFEEDVNFKACKNGLYFCKRLEDCFAYYPFDGDIHVAEVAAYGTVAKEGNRCRTDKLEIVRELTWHEVLDIVNTGKGCMGLKNSGDSNVGDCNSGSFNVGDGNSGDGNIGNYNIGDCNSGSYNIGDYNIGDCNSGSHNIGGHNYGDWNSGDYSNGCFNTKKQKLYFFNKPTDMTYSEWLNSRARYLLLAIRPLIYINYSRMTDKEKKIYPEAKTTGGYLKKVNDADRQKWWCSLSDKDKAVITSMPNFDKDIFKEITGIDVDEKQGWNNFNLD